jgi:hypothetical protein
MPLFGRYLLRACPPPFIRGRLDESRVLLERQGGSKGSIVVPESSGLKS